MMHEMVAGTTEDPEMGCQTTGHSVSAGLEDTAETITLGSGIAAKQIAEIGTMSCAIVGSIDLQGRQPSRDRWQLMLS
jgi:hypothetical protein